MSLSVIDPVSLLHFVLYRVSKGRRGLLSSYPTVPDESECVFSGNGEMGFGTFRILPDTCMEESRVMVPGLFDIDVPVKGKGLPKSGPMSVNGNPDIPLEAGFVLWGGAVWE